MELGCNSSFIVFGDCQFLEKWLEQPLPSSVDTKKFKVGLACHRVLHMAPRHALG